MLVRSQLVTAHRVIDKSGGLSNGYAIPVLGFGTYRIAPKDAYDTVRNALRLGYRHFDCAKAYCNEAAIGRALQDGMQEMKLKREDLFITGKLWQTDHRPERVEMACRRTIERLRCGYLDLYLMHWPVAWKPLPKRIGTGGPSAVGAVIAGDPDIDVNDEDLHPVDPASGQCVVDGGVTIADTWRAMEALTEANSQVPANGKGLSEVFQSMNENRGGYGSGAYASLHRDQQEQVRPMLEELESRRSKRFEPLVRSLGLSNFSADEIESVFSECSVRPVCNQIELHPGLPQTRLKAVHGMHRLVTCAYCPLGMPTRFTPDGFTGVVNDPFFRAFEKKTGFSPARLLLNWSVDLGHVVLVKAQSLKNMQDNAKVQKFALRDAMRFIFDQYHTLRPVRVINPTNFRGDGKPFFGPEPTPEGAKPSIIEAYEEAVRAMTGEMPEWAKPTPSADKMSASSGEGPLSDQEVKLRERVAVETEKRKAEAERLEKLMQTEKMEKENERKKKMYQEQEQEASSSSTQQ